MQPKNCHLIERSIEATKLDWSFLDELVRRIELGNSVSAKFQFYTLRALFRLTNDEALEAITDAGKDRGVDAVIVDEVTRQVHIFQFKYHERADHVGKQFPARSVDLAISFVTDLGSVIN